MTDFVVGQEYVRRELHGEYGGQRQGGISTPSDHPVVFIFTGPTGEQYGYSDDFQPDGSFWYTGEGQQGDMELTRGNRAIAEHLEAGETLHLFENTGNGRVRYKGEFRYENSCWDEAPDIDGNQRSVIIFKISPVR